MNVATLVRIAVMDVGKAYRIRGHYLLDWLGQFREPWLRAHPQQIGNLTGRGKQVVRDIQ